MPPHRFFIVLVFSIVPAMVALSPVIAQSTVPDATIEADEVPGCDPAQAKPLCFRVVDGDLGTLVYPGAEVTLALTAAGSLAHSLNVIGSGAADATHVDTKPIGAIATSNVAKSGTTVTITFVVPADVDKLYLWCDQGNHEPLGMWSEVPMGTPPPDNDTGGSPGNETGNETGNTTGDPTDGNATATPAPAANTTAPTNNTTAPTDTAAVAVSQGPVRAERAPGPAITFVLVTMAALASLGRRRR